MENIIKEIKANNPKIKSVTVSDMQGFDIASDVTSRQEVRKIAAYSASVAQNSRSLYRLLSSIKDTSELSTDENNKMATSYTSTSLPATPNPGDNTNTLQDNVNDSQEIKHENTSFSAPVTPLPSATKKDAADEESVPVINEEELNRFSVIIDTEEGQILMQRNEDFIVTILK